MPNINTTGCVYYKSPWRDDDFVKIPIKLCGGLIDCTNNVITVRREWTNLDSYSRIHNKFELHKSAEFYIGFLGKDKKTIDIYVGKYARSWVFKEYENYEFTLIASPLLESNPDIVETIASRMRNDLLRVDYTDFFNEIDHEAEIKNLLDAHDKAIKKAMSVERIDFATKLLNGLMNGATMPSIKKVIFNNPATIVYWNDGTKTVVKASDNDVFSKEAGLAHAIMKKYFETIGFPSPRGAVKNVIKNAHDMTKKTAEKKALKEAKASKNAEE